MQNRLKNKQKTVIKIKKMTKPKHKPYKFLTVIILSLCLIHLLPVISYAHSGRTDANGGHYNRSTGEYHYHHGYPAHQHTNGVCPYDFKDKTNHSSGSNSGSSSKSSNSSKSPSGSSTTQENSSADTESKTKSISELAKEKRAQKYSRIFLYACIIIALLFVFATMVLSDNTFGDAIIIAAMTLIPVVGLFFIIRIIIRACASPVVLGIAIFLCCVILIFYSYRLIKSHPGNRDEINCIALFGHDVYCTYKEKNRREQIRKARIEEQEKKRREEERIEREKQEAEEKRKREEEERERQEAERQRIFREKADSLKKEIAEVGIAKIVDAPSDILFDDQGNIIFQTETDKPYGRYTGYTTTSGKMVHAKRSCSGSYRPVLCIATPNDLFCSRCRASKQFTDEDAEWFVKYRQLMDLQKEYNLKDTVPEYPSFGENEKPKHNSRYPFY